MRIKDVRQGEVRDALLHHSDRGTPPDEATPDGNNSSTASIFLTQRGLDRTAHERGGRYGRRGLPHAIWMLWFFSGNERMRWPVAAKIALSTAGAATQIVGSPTPPQKPPDGMMIDSTFGICASRIESYMLKLVCSMWPSLTVHSCMNTPDRQ